MLAAFTRRTKAKPGKFPKEFSFGKQGGIEKYGVIKKSLCT
jgi:hypothetical protein